VEQEDDVGEVQLVYTKTVGIEFLLGSPVTTSVVDLNDSPYPNILNVPPEI